MQINKQLKYRNLKFEEISSLKQLQINDTDLKAEYSFSTELFGNGELVDIIIAKFLKISSQKENGKFDLPIDEKMFKNEQWKKFNKFTYSLGKMIRLSEENFDSLNSFIAKYIEKNPLSDILNRNADCRKNKEYSGIDFHKLTFANLKNILSCILKTDDSFYIVEGLKTKDERKNFSKIYSSYISNRDDFTHGKLFFLYPEYNPVLRVKRKKQEIYIEYTKDIFIDNLQSYLYLDDILSDINQIIQNEQPTNHQ